MYRRIASLLLIVATAYGGLRHNFPRPVFVYRHHPDQPMSQFIAGRLGIPEPETSRIYLYALYRYLNNRPLSADEQRSWLRVWESRSHVHWEPAVEGPGRKNWFAVRRRLQPPLGSQPSRPDEELVSVRDFVRANLCADDAYRMASATLGDRLRKFGTNSQEARWWLEGQDAVFDSCSLSGLRLPPALPASASQLLQADRAYQTASALFYGQRFDQAAAAFRAIAADTNSPWRIWAPYLVGRALLWKARVVQDLPGYQQSLLTAQQAFVSVLADGRLAATHSAAERLFIRCLLITDRKQAVRRLGARLARPASGELRESDLLRYLGALDDLHEEGGRMVALEKQPGWKDQPRDDLSQWLFNVQGPPSLYKQALRYWLAGKSNAWLFAALAKASAKSENLAALLDAATALPANAPGMTAIRYHLGRLALERGETASAREILTGLAAELSGQPSALNRVDSLKMLAAVDIEEFITLAPRRPILESSELDDGEWERDRWSDDESEWAGQRAKLPLLDDRAEAVLSLRLPLAVLADLSRRRTSLPSHLQEELQLATWTRAVLLRRWDVAGELSPLMANRFPGLSSRFQNFTASPDSVAAREEAAAHVLHRLPGAKPFLSRGYGRHKSPQQRDEWARNWWYAFNEAQMHGIFFPYREDLFVENSATSAYVPASLPFLTAPQQQEAAAELAELVRRGQFGHEWIATRLLRWAQLNPRNAAVPRTLVEVLQANRGTQWSFSPKPPASPGIDGIEQLLQTRYPEWWRKFQQTPLY